MRNLCDNCKNCEDNNESLMYCVDVCGVPLDILISIECKRNKEKDEKK